MIEFLKKYNAFIIGFFLVISTFFILHTLKIIDIPDDAPLEVILVTILWWLIVSIPIHKRHYLKTKIKTLLKIGAVVLLFFVSLIVDSFMKVPDNPITFSLLLLFWLGFVYLLVPNFIKKYWKLIVLIYGSSLIYFLYVRLFYGDFDFYQENTKSMAFTMFFVPIPLLFCLWIYEQWKWLKNLKAEKAKAELAMLQSQINPHFFFNTLNNLYSLSLTNNKQAPEVILKLSDMMRYTIYEGKKEVVPLQDEINYLENYIDLHKIRYHKTVVFNFEKNIVKEDTIAPLLFIILLENALKHGVESMIQNAFVNMKISSNTKEINFSISNNFETKELNTDKGIGLVNLKHRLALIYPNRHHLNISEKENIFTVDLKILKND